MEDEYTRIFTILAESDDASAKEETLRRLFVHLKSTGRIKLLPGILKKLTAIEARRLTQAPQVEVAHAGESRMALAEAAREGIVASHARVNESLIKGFRARADGKLVDRSAKRALIDLYQNLTI